MTYHFFLPSFYRVVAVLWLPAAFAFPAAGQEYIVNSSAACAANGRYNTSLVTSAAPTKEDKDTNPGSSTSQAAVNMAEGPLWATATSRVGRDKIRLGIGLQAGPAFNLGSTVTASAEGRFLEMHRFHLLGHSVRRGEMVLRVKGSFSKTSVPLSTGEARLAVSTADFEGLGSTVEKVHLTLDKPGRIDETVFLDLVNNDSTSTNLLEILLTPAVFICLVDVSLNLVCETGAQNGQPLAASTFVRVGTSLENPPLIGQGGGTGAGNPQDGATIAGIRFLDADGNVLDLQPGDVQFESASGFAWPILGSVLPWLGNTDNFDDNEKDPERWGGTTGSGLLVETGFSLEYRSGAGNQFATWPLKGNKAPLTENWEIQSDVHWEPLTFSNPGDEAGIGLRVSHGTHAAVVRMERRNSGASTARNFRAAESGPVAPLVTTVPAPASDSAVRLSYDAASRELSYWYDPNGATGGYAWTLIQKSNLGPSGWNLPMDALLSVETGGWSAGAGVPEGTAWMDNFRAGSWEPFAPRLETLYRENDLVTVTGFAQPNQVMTLQASDNLQIWSDLAPLTAGPDGSLSFSSAREGRKQRYFRLRH